MGALCMSQGHFPNVPQRCLMEDPCIGSLRAGCARVSPLPIWLKLNVKMASLPAELFWHRGLFPLLSGGCDHFKDGVTSKQMTRQLIFPLAQIMMISCQEKCRKNYVLWGFSSHPHNR